MCLDVFFEEDEAVVYIERRK